MRSIFLSLLLALTGCVSTTSVYPLGPEWLPLERVVEDRSISPGVTTTIYKEARVHDLREWLVDYPPGPRREALLLHEQAHSRREDGPLWFVRYAISRSFRWQEEAIGWGLEIEHLVKSRTGVVDQVAVAKALSGSTYRMFDGEPMVGYDEALAWVAGVVAAARAP